MYSGAGIYSFPDGAVYDGPFVESQMHGKGLFTDAQVQHRHRHQHHRSTSGTAVRGLPHHGGATLPTAHADLRTPSLSQGIPWRGEFYNGTGPGLPATATVIAT